MEIGAHELAQTTDCKRNGCTRVSLGATHGPYANLCDEHTEQARRERREAGLAVSRRLPPSPSPPGERPASLSQAAAELVKPAKALEAAVGRRRIATDEARARLADFNAALNAVKAAAEALLQ